MAADEGDSFFSRWSRRKAQVRSGEPAQEPAPSTAASVAVAPAVVVPAEPVPPVAEPAPPPPTLEDTQTLTPASDFSRFVTKDVPPEVRNAAVKKLFADPHFNVMDGLDIYIDDYTKTEPIPAAMMAKMVSAQFLKLVDDPEELKPKQAAVAEAPTPAAATPLADAPTATEITRAPDAAAPEETSHDDHADLQLQPDHAPGPQGPGPGTG